MAQCIFIFLFVFHSRYILLKSTYPHCMHIFIITRSIKKTSPWDLSVQLIRNCQRTHPNFAAIVQFIDFYIFIVFRFLIQMNNCRSLNSSSIFCWRYIRSNISSSQRRPNISLKRNIISVFLFAIWTIILLQPKILFFYENYLPEGRPMIWKETFF